MWPDRVSNQGHLTYESGALPTALHDPATVIQIRRTLQHYHPQHNKKLMPPISLSYLVEFSILIHVYCLIQSVILG